jgi:hypothetical protein
VAWIEEAETYEPSDTKDQKLAKQRRHLARLHELKHDWAEEHKQTKGTQ